MWVWFRVWMSALRLCLPVKTSGMLFAFSFASDGELLAADQVTVVHRWIARSASRASIRTPNGEQTST